MCVFLCKSISERGFPFSEWILGDALWTKRPNWYWDRLHDADMENGRWEWRNEKKKKAFLSFFLNTFMPHYSLCFISTSEGNECMMEVMSFHHECIVRTHCRGPERGACAFWRVNMWNRYSNCYANCVSERMLAHCELFHSKQPRTKLWIMTTLASARICKHWAADGQG